MFKKKQPTKHYVIMSTCVDSDIYDSHRIIAVAHSISEAKKKFKDEVIAEKEIIKSEQENFNISILTDREEVFKYSVASRFDKNKYWSRVTIYIVEVSK